MNDEEWRELDARLKKAFDEIKASCSKARKHGRPSNSDDEQAAAGEPPAGEGMSAAADAATDGSGIDAAQVDCELNQAGADTKRCDKSQTAN